MGYTAFERAPLGLGILMLSLGAVANDQLLTTLQPASPAAV